MVSGMLRTRLIIETLFAYVHYTDNNRRETTTRGSHTRTEVIQQL